MNENLFSDMERAHHAAMRKAGTDVDSKLVSVKIDRRLFDNFIHLMDKLHPRPDYEWLTKFRAKALAGEPVLAYKGCTIEWVDIPEGGEWISFEWR